MSWHKITLPLKSDGIDPTVVQIGKLVWDVYEKENKPAGFGMYHAMRGSEGGLNDTFIVYLTPVATELSTEVLEDFTLEPCDVPARDEPGAAFVFGDPLTKNLLKEKFEPEPGTIEWARAEAVRAGFEATYEFDYKAEQARAAAAAQAESTQTEDPDQAESAQA